MNSSTQTTLDDRKVNTHVRSSNLEEKASTSITEPELNHGNVNIHKSTSSENNPPRPMKPWVWFRLSSAVLFATLLLALDNTVVADLQPQIVDELHDVSKFPWINHSFDLGSVGTGLLWYVCI